MLLELVVYMARRVAGAEGEELASEVVAWIERSLERDYPWPGNYRELEQCIKNVLIRRDYRPSRVVAEDPVDELGRDFREGRLTAEQLLSRYCASVYRQTRSYEETARRVKLDSGSVEKQGPAR